MSENEQHAKDVPQSIFQMYDIRGVVGETLTAELMHEIGCAFGTAAVGKSIHEVVVGCDGRDSSPEFKSALINGLLSTGCNAIDIGMVPTPVVYFATHHLNTRTGLMVTASHNPPEYNGVKLVLDGRSIYGEDIQILRDTIVRKQYVQGKGKLTEQSVVQDYSNRVCSGIRMGRRQLRIVLDCANGVAGSIAPQILHRIGCEVEKLYCEVDSSFPNHGADPTRVENLQDLIAKVQESKADLGLALDGDGDRLVAISPDGEIIWPDRLMILFAQDVLKRNPGSSIVFDVKCTRALKREIEKADGVGIIWKTGHSLLKAKLAECGGKLGGEMSGHFFFADCWYGFDDGIYAGVRLCELLSNETRSVSEVFSSLPKLIGTPEIRVQVHDPHKLVEQFKEKVKFPNAELNFLDGVRADFPDGFGLMRASNTAPEVVFRFEADTEAGLNRIREDFRNELISIQPQYRTLVCNSI